MKRTGSAIWNGGLKDGKGRLSTQSGVLDQTPYGFNARFEEGPGTNPEELIAAAHAGCFSMALSAELGEAGFVPTELRTSATVTLDKLDDGFAISRVHLDLVADVPNIGQQDFDAIANRAKVGCPVSKLLNAEITLNSRLSA